MNSAQADGLIDLFMVCRLATEVWKDLPSVSARAGEDFTEVRRVRELADELLESGIPQHRIVYVLSTHLPAPLFRKQFPALEA